MCMQSYIVSRTCVHLLSFSRIGFVTQDDVLLPQLTVEETLAFAAFLRLPSNMSKEQKYAKVEMIIKELGLERYIFFKLVLDGIYTFFKVVLDDIYTHS